MSVLLSISLYFELRRLLGGSGKEVRGGPGGRTSPTGGGKILREKSLDSSQMYVFLSISLYFDLRRLLGGSGKEVRGGPGRPWEDYP